MAVDPEDPAMAARHDRRAMRHCSKEFESRNNHAETRSVDVVMITVPADFNHLDSHGRLLLDDLHMHQKTPFAEITEKHEPIIFLDGEDMVRGELVHDPELGWIGEVDWSTQDIWEVYPGAVAARG